MNIASCFLSSLTSSPRLSSSQKSEDFLGHVFPLTEGLSPQLPQLLSAGSIHAGFPWSFEIDNLDCFLLLYTKSGCGKLSVNNQVYTLAPSTLLFLDCSCHFHMDLTIQPWSYQVLFIKGELLSTYYHLLSDCEPRIINISEFSGSAMSMAQLAEAKGDGSLRSLLIMSDLINHIITDILTALSKESTPAASTSSWLLDMREQFDENYQSTFSLDELSARYHVSKYRLCREFGNAFGYSPIQYLNRRRMEAAVHLLQATDLRIHQVGSRVGIDNTNHFIHLFKKYMGDTPCNYKQRMLS